MAISHFAHNGYHVALPIADIQRYDLIVEKEGVLQRVEVKSTRFKQKKGYYLVGLKTNGGNQTGAHKIKPISKNDCDIVFIYCEDGTSYLIPIEIVDGRSVQTLSPKYDPYKL